VRRDRAASAAAEHARPEDARDEPHLPVLPNAAVGTGLVDQRVIRKRLRVRPLRFPIGPCCEIGAVGLELLGNSAGLGFSPRSGDAVAA